MPSLFLETFRKEIIPKLQQELGIKNAWAVPRITKAIVNVGVGTYLKTNKDLNPLIENLSFITGQRPALRKSKKAISNFKLKKGMPVGLITTLRGKRLYDFLHRLINIVLPRVRDFRGFPQKYFDGQGNYSLGLREQTVFPEIDPQATMQTHGLEITLVTTAKDDKEGYALLKAIGFPFKKD